MDSRSQLHFGFRFCKSFVFLIANFSENRKREFSVALQTSDCRRNQERGVHSPRPFVLHSHKYTNAEDDWFLIFHFTKTDTVSILCNNVAFELTMYCFCFLSVYTSHNKIWAHCLSGSAAVLKGEGAGIRARAPSLLNPPSVWASSPQAPSSPAPLLPDHSFRTPLNPPTPVSPQPPLLGRLLFPFPGIPFPFSSWAPSPGPSPKFHQLPRPPSPGSLP